MFKLPVHVDAVHLDLAGYWQWWPACSPAAVVSLLEQCTHSKQLGCRHRAQTMHLPAQRSCSQHAAAKQLSHWCRTWVARLAPCVCSVGHERALPLKSPDIIEHPRGRVRATWVPSAPKLACGEQLIDTTRKRARHTQWTQAKTQHSGGSCNAGCSAASRTHCVV
jgi:hypothetical protein